MSTSHAARPIQLFRTSGNVALGRLSPVVELTRPERGRTASRQEIAHARQQTVAALGGPSPVEWLEGYYHADSTHAGGTFLSVGPVDPYAITATDFYAISLLSVKIGPRTLRQLLPALPVLDHRLCAIPVEADLTTADEDTFRAAEDFYLAVAHALGGNPWVTASKLCARKRPNLFPVRDRIVTVDLLGVGKDYWVDWQVYRDLLTAADTRQRFDTVVQQALDRGAAVTDPPLRVLDVLLWMHAKERQAVD